MRLYLVQHGEAKTEAEDRERPLNESGVRAVERAARWSARMGVAVRQIRHSGKRRAEQTADILARYLEPAGGVHAVQGLAPNDDVAPVAAVLAGESDDLMLVGHLPFLARLADRLVGVDADASVVRFTNAGVVCLRRDEGRWMLDWALPPTLMD
jgi:phosphohistidine phosphatase